MVNFKMIENFEAAKYEHLALERAMNGALDLLADAVPDDKIISIQSTEESVEKQGQYVATVKLKVFYRE